MGKNQHTDAALAQELTWKVLDGLIEPEEQEHLQALLEHSEPARRSYLDVVQLHVGLLGHFGALPQPEDILKKALGNPAICLPQETGLMTPPLAVP